jgi:hypothetical protein
MTLTTSALALFTTRRLILLAVLAMGLLVLVLALTASAEARPMLDPCTYERPVCPTYTPR